MKTGYDKAKVVVDAALGVLDTEARWSAGESAAPGRPYQTEMRNLKEAVDDYLKHREKSWGAPPSEVPPPPEVPQA